MVDDLLGSFENADKQQVKGYYEAHYFLVMCEAYRHPDFEGRTHFISVVDSAPNFKVGSAAFKALINTLSKEVPNILHKIVVLRNISTQQVDGKSCSYFTKFNTQLFADKPFAQLILTSYKLNSRDSEFTLPENAKKLKVIAFVMPKEGMEFVQSEKSLLKHQRLCAGSGIKEDAKGVIPDRKKIKEIGKKQFDSVIEIINSITSKVESDSTLVEPLQKKARIDRELHKCVSGRDARNLKLNEETGELVNPAEKEAKDNELLKTRVFSSTELLEAYKEELRNDFFYAGMICTVFPSPKIPFDPEIAKAAEMRLAKFKRKRSS